MQKSPEVPPGFFVKHQGYQRQRMGGIPDCQQPKP